MAETEKRFNKNYHYKDQDTVFVCDNCGRSFTPRNNYKADITWIAGRLFSVYCCEACRKQSDYKQRENIKNWATCLWCENKFNTTKNSNYLPYCCASCEEEHKRSRNSGYPAGYPTGMGGAFASGGWSAGEIKDFWMKH